MRPLEVTEEQKSDQSERAGRLTGSIFVPGMAANWFQQEAVVRHDQSDVRRRSGSSRRGTRGWWAVKSLKKKKQKLHFMLKAGSVEVHEEM